MNAALEALHERPPRPKPPAGPYLVAGVARAGLAAAAALERLEGPARVKAWDGFVSPVTEQARSRLGARGIECELGGTGVHMLREGTRPACVVKSPGIPFEVPLLVEAARRGVTIIDELELGWRLGSAPLIAVTGTNGKSTTASLLLAALEGASINASLAGNTDFGPTLSSLATDAPDTQCVVCEVSSYQLGGCPGVLPEAAVLTNLSRDHLHRHGTMERYGQVKRRLFVRKGKASPLTVLNTDQAYGRELADLVERTGGRVVRYGTGREADYRLEHCEWDLSSQMARIRTPEGAITVVMRHPGTHNAVNLTAAIALAGALGLDLDAILPSVAAAPPVPGRFEPIEEGQPFDVVVDFAHNPDALDQAMRAARQIVSTRPGGRLVAVVSTPGTHDPPKRPQMGRIARRLADQLVITTTSTYGEAHAVAAEGLLDGALGVEGGALTVELDRSAAIEQALRTAAASDLVLIAGRGALPTLRLDRSGAGPPFDDRVIVRQLLGKLAKSANGWSRAADGGKRSSGRALLLR